MCVPAMSSRGATTSCARLISTRAALDAANLFTFFFRLTFKMSHGRSGPLALASGSALFLHLIVMEPQEGTLECF